MEFNMIVCNETYKSELLVKYTNKINQLISKGNSILEDYTRKIAVILAQIGDQKLYKEDGFTSVADYAVKSFGIKRSTAYMLYRAGKMYMNDDLCEQAKSLTPSKVVELSGVDIGAINQLCDYGKINTESTQNDLRQVASEYMESHSTDESGMKDKTECKGKRAATLYQSIVFDADSRIQEVEKITVDKIGSEIKDYCSLLALRTMQYTDCGVKYSIHIMVYVVDEDFFHPVAVVYYPMVLNASISEILKQML